MKPPFPDGVISTFGHDTPHYFLSNFYPCLGSSTEHLYQAAKTDDFNQKKYIMSQPTAGLAKKIGRIVTCRPTWEKDKLMVMYEVLKKKFAPGTPLEVMLWKTGNVHLIEGNHWHDLFWGQCYCPKHQWEGQNHLGETLMQVRSEIVGWEHAKGVESVL